MVLFFHTKEEEEILLSLVCKHGPSYNFITTMTLLYLYLCDMELSLTTGL